MTELLQKLKNQYGEPKNLLCFLEEKCSFEKPDDGGNDTPPDNHEILFSNDEKKNRIFLHNLIDCKYFSVLQNTPAIISNERKLIIQYKSSIESLLSDNKMLDYPEYLASKFKNIWLQNLQKLWGIKNYKTILNAYLKENHITMISFQKGHLLSDDDLEKLDVNMQLSYIEKTPYLKLKDRVIEMVQPVIQLWYQNKDEEIELKQIPGVCKYYVYQKA